RARARAPARPRRGAPRRAVHRARPVRRRGAPGRPRGAPGRPAHRRDGHAQPAPGTRARRAGGHPGGGARRARRRARGDRARRLRAPVSRGGGGARVTYLRQIGVIVWKDALLELRTRERVASMGAFAVLAAVLFHFSIDTSVVRPQDVAAGLVWMT